MNKNNLSKSSDQEICKAEENKKNNINIWKIHAAITKTRKEEKGQIMPFIAIIFVIIVIFVAFSVGTSLHFYDSKATEDALDAALLSALAGAVRETSRPTYYGDCLYRDYRICHRTTGHRWCIQWRTVDGRRRCVRRCSNGIRYFLQFWYVPYETFGNHANYIYIDRNRAERIFLDYLNANLEGAGSAATVRNVNISYEFDDERFFEVRKEMDYLRPVAPGRRRHCRAKAVPGGQCVRSRACSCCLQYEVRGVSENPEAYWFNEFGNSVGFDERNHSSCPDLKDWTLDLREDRIIRFPSWVKMHATVEFDVPVLLGNIDLEHANLGTSSEVIKVEATAIRELEQLRDPRPHGPRKPLQNI